MKKYELILKAYTILDEITPLRYDCGKLCSSYCCANNGTDGETLGMWLLPYEKELLEVLSENDEKTKYTFKKSENSVDTVYCDGFCTRSIRPFACRIYPFYPHISTDENGRTKINIRIDPRATISCPIAMKTSYLRPQIRFISSIKSAVRILMKNDEIKKDICETSDFLFEIEQMRAMFNK